MVKIYSKKTHDSINFRGSCFTKQINQEKKMFFNFLKGNDSGE